MARDTLIQVRARQSERDLLDEAAQRLGTNRSEFVRQAATRSAIRTLVDPENCTWNRVLAEPEGVGT